MPELEFERKYVLDTRRADDIAKALVENGPNFHVVMIRQYYDGDTRYRCTYNGGMFTCVREKKRSLKVNTPYSVSLEEDPEPINLDQFNDGWDRWPGSSARLRKCRHLVDGAPGQKVMVDFFMDPTCRLDEGNIQPPYAVVAEVEIVLTEDSKVLFLELDLPIYLRDFLLKSVDARDVSAKAFKSTNMTESNIPAIQRALVDLYEHKPA